ncbi:MAG: FtsQ-type POTRA domain-containing protein [Alphaproteobacteria bacterium]|nr:FtsQ-type POTRA domain-containing protein [Alphaproteobacteria bacterium]
MARKKAVVGARKSVLNKRRRGFLGVLIPWARRFGFALVLVGGLIWLGAWLTLNGTLGRGKDWMENKILMASADMGFAVENILVDGRVYTNPQILMAIVNVGKGDPLFSFDPRAAQALISKIGWVESASVERRWPDTIYIGLKERKPMALWQDEKTLKLLDSNGTVITADRLERFGGLPVVAGPDAPAHAAALLAGLRAEPVLQPYIAYARRLGERRWDLVLKGGVIVRLPEEDLGLALRRLASAQEENSILEKDIVSIDLRESGRLVVQTKPGAVEEYKASLKIEAKTGSSI